MAAIASFDRESGDGLVRWTGLLVGPSALLRAGEFGVDTLRFGIDTLAERISAAPVEHAKASLDAPVTPGCRTSRAGAHRPVGIPTYDTRWPNIVLVAIL